MTYRFARSCIALGLAGILSGCASTGTQRKYTSSTDRARIMLNLGNEALIEGDAVSALESLKAAESLDSNLPEVHHSMAVAYYMKHDAASAIREARKAVDLAPNYSQAHTSLGKFLLETGQLKAAETPLLRAANDVMYREAYKANINLGIVYYKLGRMEESLIRFNRAVSDNPNNSCIAYYYIGHIRLAAGNFKEALKNYDHATTRLCASFAEAHLAKGIAYERNKNYDQARKKYLDIKSSFPDTKVAEDALERLRFLP